MLVHTVLVCILLFLVIFSIFLLFVNKRNNNIIKLKKTESLESKLDEKTFIAILAPWCGFCEQIKKSNILNKLSKYIKIIEINDTHPQVNDILESSNSEGFPTFIIYKNENFYKYSGYRSLNSLLNFIK